MLDALTAKLGWNSPLAQSDLLLAWPELVGEETAAHSTPTGIADGLLTVQCDIDGMGDAAPIDALGHHHADRGTLSGCRHHVGAFRRA